jgi:hypothetical protein
VPYAEEAMICVERPAAAIEGGSFVSLRMTTVYFATRLRIGVLLKIVEEVGIKAFVAQDKPAAHRNKEEGKEDGDYD